MGNSVNGEEKRAFILLNAIIFHYHGLDENEEKILLRMAKENDADDELKWCGRTISFPRTILPHSKGRETI